MRIVYLDCFSGISGDMFVGALLDAGVPFELLQKTVTALNVEATLTVSRVDRGGISATKLDVIVNGERDMPREKSRERPHREENEQLVEEFSAATPVHMHSHAEGAAETHKRSHSHGEQHAHDDAPSRRLSEILHIISVAPIGQKAKQTASEIFVALGAAEAKVHAVDLEQIRFHEVGAVDAIVDIVCAAVGADALGADRFVSSPLNVGGGTVACLHGTLPVPAPATLELLKDVPVYSGEIQKELVTPTGAAIVKVLVSDFAARPLMSIDKIGYGAGARNIVGCPNVLRLTVGETQKTLFDEDTPQPDAPSREEIAILEANLDDLNPQLIAYIVDLALAEGALDVFTTPVQMKKGRPGTVLTILAKPAQEERMRALLFNESSTLGIRIRYERRFVLPRRYVIVTTPWGEVRVKVGMLNGAVSQYAPEFEDCRRIAAEHHVPLKAVMQEAIRLYLDQSHGETR